MRVWLTMIPFVACLSFQMVQAATEKLTLLPRIQVVTPQLQLSDEVQTWLDKHPVLKVGVWGSAHPPIGGAMSQGVYQGISADYLASLEKSLNIKVELFYYHSSREAIEALNRHEINMLAMWNPSRWPTRSAQASIPWLIDNTVILKHNADDITPSTLSNQSLGVVPDDFSTNTLKQQFPGATLHYFSEFDQALNALTFGQINALLLNRTTADFLLYYYQIEDLVQISGLAYTNLDLSFGVDSEQPLLLSAINSFLEQLPLASRLRIASGWGLGRNTVMMKNPLGLTQAEENWLEESKKIPVLIDSHQPPISFVAENGEPEGLVVDVLDRINRQYGINFEYLTYSNETQRLNLLSEHPDALIANGWINDGTEKTEKFTQILTSAMVVIVNAENPIQNSFDKLKGERVAILKDNPLKSWLETWYPTIELVSVDNLNQGIERLKSGRIRGIIAPQFVADYFLLQHNDKSLSIDATVPTSASQLGLTPAGNNAIPFMIVDKALNDLTPAQLTNLIIPWRKVKSISYVELTTQNLWSVLALSLLLIVTFFASLLWIRSLRRALNLGRQAQSKLSDQLALTQALIDNAPVAMYVRDIEGHLLQYNRNWAELLKVDETIALGKKIKDVTSLELHVRDQLEKNYQEILSQGKPTLWSGTYILDGKDHFLSGWTVPWQDSHGNIAGLIGGWLDITEHQSLILKLEQTRTALERANASKAAFMQTMGHEVRTPLNAIIGLLEIELQSQQSNSQPSDNLPLIWESACNLLSLIGDVFDIFRADNPKLMGSVRSVNMPQLINSTVALYQLQAEEKGLQIEIESVLHEEQYEIDALVIIRIFSSLLRNAIKHSTGATITVALFQGRQEPNSVTIPLVIEVSNQGEISNDGSQAPIESDDLSEVWSDTGISLTACQSLAKKINSEIAIDSGDDETAVSLYIQANPSAAHKIIVADSSDTQLHILIVDDYQPGRRALQQQLESWGHRVSHAENGEQGLYHWQQHRNQINLIITDCTMPVMDGFVMTQSIRAIEQNDSSPPILIFGLTALTSFEASAHCLASGMNECLIKPLSSRALHDILTRYFTQLRPASEIVEHATLSTEIKADMVALHVDDAQKLRESIASQQREVSSRLAHRIRGSASLLRDEHLISLCRNLESRCEIENDWEKIESLANELFSHLDKVNSELLSEIDEENSYKNPL